MYAIVEIAGQQFKVAKDQKVYVHRLQGEKFKEEYIPTEEIQVCFCFQSFNLKKFKS